MQWLAGGFSAQPRQRSLQAGSRSLRVLERVAVAEGTPEVPKLLPQHQLKSKRRARTEPLNLLALGLRRSTGGQASRQVCGRYIGMDKVFALEQQRLAELFC
jgi:hypothetical protein